MVSQRFELAVLLFTYYPKTHMLKNMKKVN